jgi:multiple sugar transport system permease protein
MAARTSRINTGVVTSPYYAKQLRRFTMASLVTLFATLALLAYLSPFAYMAVTSLKTKDQIVASATGPILPVEPSTVEYDGELVDILQVPFDDGTVHNLGIIQKGRNESTFIDPANPDGEPIVWEGRWRSLTPVYEYSFKVGNFAEAWEKSRFPRLLFNTAFIAITGVLGTLLSSVCVAYAFARFPIPGKRIMFLLLISTIILPQQVILVPTFAFFSAIGWTGTWLPLIIPHFFSNGYNVFLLRQYFLGLPRELDEAAMIDGANPFQILRFVIIPQSWPVIVAVGLFHLVFAWNDYFQPLIYTLGNPEIQPIAVGIQLFNQRFDQQPHLIQSTALLGLLLPVFLFFMAQRFFMRGVVVTGVEK